jgi:TetR/AcrR family transcriptional regulator, copper-responsive repressor
MKRSALPPEAAAPLKPRGRPRSFDRDAALAAAMDVFWQKGFEATSISDLTEAMGINPPSLYSAFGDKEQLFLEAIETYSKRRGESCPYSDEPTARGAVETLLTYMAQDLTESSHPRGCLMMMAAATAANTSAALQKVLAQKRLASRECLRARIKRGIDEGDVPAGTDATALADFYSTILAGMSLQARDGASRRSLMATVAQAMSPFPKALLRKRGARERSTAAA